MNEPENDLRTASRFAEVSEKYEDLRRQFNLLFGGLIITSFTLTAYLGLEAKRTAAELVIVKPRTEEALKLVQQDDAEAEMFYSKLTEFARAHPDFQNKILFKYKISTNAPVAAPKK